MKTATASKRRKLAWCFIALVIAGVSALVIFRWYIASENPGPLNLPGQDDKGMIGGITITVIGGQDGHSQLQPTDAVDQGALFPVSDRSGMWGYINRRGDLTGPFQFDRAEFFPEGLDRKFAVVATGIEGDAKCGYMDRSGKITIPIQYTYCGYFSEGLATVQVDNHVDKNQMQVINEHGVVVVPRQFNSIGYFTGGTAPALLQAKWGYIDTGGQWVIRPQFDHAESFSEGMAVVGLRPCGFIDRSGKVVIPRQFDSCGSFEGGTALVAKYGFWGRFLTGTSLGHFFLRTVPRDEGDMPAWSPTRYSGFIKPDGTWQVQPAFVRLGRVRSGLAVAGDHKTFGYVNRNGQYVIAPQFAWAGEFRDGYAVVLAVNPAKWEIIDTTGKTVVTLQIPQFSQIFNAGDGVFGIIQLTESTDRRYIRPTYIDAGGRTIWPH